MRKPRTLAVALVVSALLALSGCGGSDDNTAGEAELQTVTPGKLTIATGEPAYEPWVVNDDPASGEGFEAAVAYAVAEELGFAKEDVVWVRTPFDTVIAPGPKNFDFNIQQFSITEDRQKAVDFSSPYYVTTPALVSVKGNKGADAKSVADLAGTVIGAATGTTTLNAITDIVGSTAEVQVFNSNEDAVQALAAGNIDALAVDLPTALYLSAVEIENGVLVGQFDSNEGGDEFGLLLEKGSSLTEAVTKAVDALRDNGTLAKLEATWLTDAAGAPVLK